MMRKRPDDWKEQKQAIAESLQDAANQEQWP